MVSEPRALKLLSGYYDLLTTTGYVKHRTLKVFLIYLFILDFVEYMHAYINEENYKVIDKALSRLFANGGCLFSYPVFCERRATLSANKAVLSSVDPFTGYRVRLTEKDAIRSTEDEHIRIVEV